MAVAAASLALSLVAVVAGCSSGGSAGIGAADASSPGAGDDAGACAQTQALPAASCGDARAGATCSFPDGAYCVTTYGDTGRCATEYVETCCGGQWQSSVNEGTHPSSGQCPTAPVEGAACRSAVDDCGNEVSLDCSFACPNGATARSTCSNDVLHVYVPCPGGAEAGAGDGGGASDGGGD